MKDCVQSYFELFRHTSHDPSNLMTGVPAPAVMENDQNYELISNLVAIFSHYLFLYLFIPVELKRVLHNIGKRNRGKSS